MSTPKNDSPGLIDEICRPSSEQSNRATCRRLAARRLGCMTVQAAILWHSEAFGRNQTVALASRQWAHRRDGGATDTWESAPQNAGGTCRRFCHGPRRLFSEMVLLSTVLICVGCQPSAAIKSRPPDDQWATIHIDRSENGAAADLQAERGIRNKPIARRLAFEVIGSSARPPADATREQRAAVSQAAIIDAFFRALIETRRTRGQSVEDFTIRLGPHLIAVRHTIDEVNQLEAHLIVRGIETIFIVKDGVLQHPPNDFTLIQELFAETHGEFSLLSTDTSTIAGVCTARVGCYTPIERGTTLAGTITDAPTRP